MKTVTLRLDRNSKLILTIIAIALVLIALKPFLPEDLQATPQVIDVNIASIYGETYPYMTYGRLPISGSVEIDGEVDVNVTNSQLNVYDWNK
jgi:hypothetical protein